MINRNRLFVGCIMSLVATAFGFAVRGAILDNWRAEFNLTQEQIGYLQGVGLFPFAISIILFSLIIDRIGNGVSMAIAFGLHVVSAVITLAAPLAGPETGYTLLYIGTFVFALGNGTVEAVVNPVTATLFSREKTRYLNILHAGWPGGLVLGGLLAIAVSVVDPASVPGRLWQWQMGLVLLPTIAYGAILLGQKFPVQERVAAKVPYFDMLREFGAGSCYVVSFFLVAGLNQILLIAGIPSLGLWTQLGIALIPTLAFAMYVKSFGQPVFVLLLLVMLLLATTELGTDSWISDIMRTVLGSPTLGTLFLVWTSAIMFVLRFFAGPIVHKISPLGLLAVCSGVGAIGLLWLSQAGTAAMALFIAATFYAFGKTFFWPTTLGVVSERFPRGGALMLNAIAGVGMISVGTIGNPAIGTVQDMAFAAEIRAANPSLAARVIVERPGMFGESSAIDPAKRAQITDPAEQALLAQIDSRTKQATLGKIAVLPVVMLLCYLGLILYFRSTGGYRAEQLAVEASGHGVRIVDLGEEPPAMREQAATLLMEGFEEHLGWPTLDLAREEVARILAEGFARATLDGDSLLGWVGGLPEYDGRVWELHPMIVRREYRRRGIGRALVEAFEIEASNRGGFTATLGTDDESGMTSLSNVDLYGDVAGQIEGIRDLGRSHPFLFYSRLGYVVTGVLPDANGPGKPDIFMSKRLSK